MEDLTLRTKTFNLSWRHYAPAEILTLALFLFWLSGTALFGKDFSYLSLGPLFITELTLFFLIVLNLKQLRVADLVFILVVCLYFTAGYLKHGNYFMAAKDISWFYYLLFARFCPSFHPTRSTALLVTLASVGLLLAVFTQLSPSLLNLGLEVEKYRSAILFFFLLGFWFYRLGTTLALPIVALGSIIAFIIDFKTAILLTLVFPFIWALRDRIRKFITPTSLVIFTLTICLAAYFNLMTYILQFAVKNLNLLTSMVGSDRIYKFGTSVWRADIWSSALSNLVRDGDLLFGHLPGWNFMNSQWLGIRAYLPGGEELGVVRSAHNILVQILMKSGVVGLIIWLSYLYRWVLKDLKAELVPFALSVFVMGLTSDLFEVPSRGPLFFCFLVITQRYFFMKYPKDGSINLR